MRAVRVLSCLCVLCCVFASGASGDEIGPPGWPAQTAPAAATWGDLTFETVPVPDFGVGFDTMFACRPPASVGTTGVALAQPAPADRRADPGAADLGDPTDSVGLDEILLAPTDEPAVPIRVDSLGSAIVDDGIDLMPALAAAGPPAPRPAPAELR